MPLVECLLCLPVLQVYCNCVYLDCKSIVAAGICTLCVYSVVTGLSFLCATMGRKKILCTCDPACKGGVRKDSNTLLCQLITMIIWLTCQMEQALCPPLHLLVQDHPVALIVTVISDNDTSSSGSCSEQDNIVTVSDDSE